LAFKIITVPFNHEKECFLEDDINRFCLNKRILSYKPEFFKNGERAYWTVFIEYEQVLAGVNQSNENLTDEQRLFYKRLKQWRRQKAEETGVPVYIICKNKQLEDIVKKSPKTIESLKMINGFGKKKIESYGKQLITLVNDFFNKS